MLVALIVIVSGCKKADLPEVPAQNSTLIFRGYPHSGVFDMYWTYNLTDKKLDILSNQESVDLLDYIYYQGNKNNVDEQKVQHHYDIIGQNLADDFYKKLLNSFKPKDEKIKELPNLPVDDDKLLTSDSKIKIISDHKKNDISIIDLETGVKDIVKIKNRFWGQVLSPDDSYVAFFEYQPYVFRDGSVYRIDFVDLKTKKLYTINNLFISLPTAIMWVKNR
ncbi:MAG: hypothetical protein AB7V50_04165 [Vampirovibrionia bacterium]